MVTTFGLVTYPSNETPTKMVQKLLLYAPSILI
ncbi:hypothetical protein GBAR_LOCUS23523 [Geodia barretti]|uniref:Uncharacterized protein n=1 Tax=Geodia barretti TaxID=519541 RepID=A0AA35T8K7_GEOBA|nr:hypothetical protein GBAR_LOCUS23523 [Geodia barretti]